MLDQELLRLAGLPYYRFRPRPDSLADLDQQASFVKDKFDGTAVCLAGNGAGKSTCGAYKVARFLFETPAPRQDTPFWILSQSQEMAAGVCWNEKLSQFIGPEHIKHVTWYNQGRGFPSAIVLHNGWVIEIKSYDMDRKRLTGRSIGGFWLDEPCEHSLLVECIARTRDYQLSGNKIYTLTPLIALPELQDIYEHQAENPDYRFYRMNSACNKTLAPGFVDQLLRQEQPHLRETRQTGAFGAVPNAVFRREWFRTYTEDAESYYLDRVVRKADCYRICVVDLAISLRNDADYTVAQVWDITPNANLVLVFEWRARAEGPTTVQHLTAIYERFAPALIGIEDVAFQRVVLQLLRQSGLPVLALSTHGADKLARSARAQIAAEAGFVWVPPAAWVKNWLAEILCFPGGAFMDRGDCLSYAAILAAKRGVVTPPPDVVEESEVEREQRIMWQDSD